MMTSTGASSPGPGSHSRPGLGSQSPPTTPDRHPLADGIASQDSVLKERRKNQPIPTSSSPAANTWLLLCAYAQRHARHVRHATQEDLDCLEELLGDLRKLPQLRERKRGYFSRGSHAFLHFHEDAGAFYVDVRLNVAFQRMRVTTRDEQTAFLEYVGRAVESNP
jgi:hypothetical protein